MHWVHKTVVSYEPFFQRLSIVVVSVRRAQNEDCSSQKPEGSFASLKDAAPKGLLCGLFGGGACLISYKEFSLGSVLCRLLRSKEGCSKQFAARIVRASFCMHTTTPSY